MAAIEDPGAIAVGGELEGCEDPFANFESYLYMCIHNMYALNMFVKHKYHGHYKTQKLNSKTFLLIPKSLIAFNLLTDT